MIPKTEPATSIPLHANGTTNVSTDNSLLNSRMPVHNPYSLQQPPKLTEFTAEEKARLNVDLAKYLPPEFAATRPGPGRSTLTYIEGWRIKNLANKLFGFDGWSSAITDVTVDFLDIDHEGKVSVGVSVMVRVSLKDGTYHEDIGYGSSESQKSKASSFEKAKKEATTDGLKRALTAFGNVLGTCLYDKNFCRHLSMQKVDKPKFDSKEMYYYPEEAWSTQLLQQQHQINQVQQQQQQQNQQQQQQQQAHNPYQQQNQPQPQQQYKPQQPQQAAYGAGPSSATSNNVASARQRNTVPVQQAPKAAPQIGSLNGGASTLGIRRGSVPTGVGGPNQHQNQSSLQTNVKVEEDDVDRFFGADIEDSRASQPESPRMDDFDIELDIMDMMNDDSPVKLKANEVAGFVGSGQPVLRRSGSLTRSTSSPVLTQTTKAMPTLQKPQKLNLQPLKVPNTTVGTSTSMSPAFGDNPFAPKQTMFSISSTASPSTAFCPPKPPASSAPLSTKQDTSQKNQKAPVNMPQNQKHWDSKDSSSPSPQNLVGAQIPPTMNGTKNIYRANSLAASAANAINSSDSASSLNQHSTTHNYRVPAPSAVHQSMYLTNPVQGTGLKRPLGTGSLSDTRGSVVSKEPRLG